MKRIYMTLAFFAILLMCFVFINLLDIPSPNKKVVETYTLEVK
tara:strand:- start:279 stop:407 length:129 start_codon:yes stop_codon:yes gene_type:complete